MEPKHKSRSGLICRCTTGSNSSSSTIHPRARRRPLQHRGSPSYRFWFLLCWLQECQQQQLPSSIAHQLLSSARAGPASKSWYTVNSSGTWIKVSTTTTLPLSRFSAGLGCHIATVTTALSWTMPTSRKRRQSSSRRCFSDDSTDDPHATQPHKTIPPGYPTSQTTTTSNNDDDSSTFSKTLLNDYPLLQAWIQHDDVSFHYLAADEARQIRNQLQSWYRQHRRKLPWRGDPPPWQGSTVNFATTKRKRQPTELTTPCFQSSSSDASNATFIASIANQTDNVDDSPLDRTYPVTAYGVWVSEIMLQQTRVEAVVAKWCQWMTSFPTVEALAAATPDQVNAHWAGLGFYRRARLLHSAAQALVQTQTTDDRQQPEGQQPPPQLPDTVAGWQALPGVGRYTASAVASIAINVTVPVVDGNVCRVLARLRCVSQTIKATSFKDRHGWDLAGQIVGQAAHDDTTTLLDASYMAEGGGTAGEVNQALMELGATYCAPSGTGTDPNDPLYEFYWSTRLAREAADFGRRGGNLNDIIQSLHQEPRDKFCQLCAEQGVTLVLQNLNTLLSETLNKEDCAKFGHAVFPLAPPKVHKREDVLAVAAISCRDTWLLVKRPEDGGLLSGQWEFPAVVVWSSESDTSKRTGQRQDKSQSVPRVATSVRRTAIRKLLREVALSPSLCEISLHSVGQDPIEHIFSHVRHTMWLDHAVVAEGEPEKIRNGLHGQSSNVRWMNAAEMQKVGVTSGFQKVLNAVHQERTKSTPKPKTLKRSKKS
jgi:A/G-specific adenine glycosylase